MSFLSKLFGTGVKDVAGGVAEAIDRFVETPDEKRAAKIIIDKIQHESDKWQMEINKVEAQHPSIFVSGWRPAVGWVCVLALFWGWFLAPVLHLFISKLPNIPTEHPEALILALLGAVGARSWEKAKGVARQ